MREYGKVTPGFWIGKTGKAIRGKPNQQLLALYLMTSPHAEMTGVYYCPILNMAHEIGIPIEGASKGLLELKKAHFCDYDEESELVFVYRMAAFQIGDSLKANDKRVLGLRRTVEGMPEGRIKTRFLEIYGEAYHLLDLAEKDKGHRSPSGAPPKPRAGAGAGSRAGASKKPPAKKTGKRKTTIPANFTISDRVKEWAKKNGHTRLEEHLEAFILKATAKGYQYIDWDAAFMEAIRNNWARLDPKAAGPRREL